MVDGPQISIVRVDSDEDLAEVRRLFIEYAASLPIDLAFQGFEQELLELPGQYGPPSGCILLARYRGNVAGCIAVRRLSDDICEGKRLYARPQFRGNDIGKQLKIAILREAKRLGYRRFRWDSLGFMTAANALYMSIGAKRIPPYHDKIIEGMVCWEIDLTQFKIDQATMSSSKAFYVIGDGPAD